jgi:hypothetical protein
MNSKDGCRTTAARFGGRGGSILAPQGPPARLPFPRLPAGWGPSPWGFSPGAARSPTPSPRIPAPFPLSAFGTPRKGGVPQTPDKKRKDRRAGRATSPSPLRVGPSPPCGEGQLLRTRGRVLLSAGWRGGARRSRAEVRCAAGAARTYFHPPQHGALRYPGISGVTRGFRAFPPNSASSPGQQHPSPRPSPRRLPRQQGREGGGRALLLTVCVPPWCFGTP